MIYEENNQSIIYKLIDPRDNTIKYIGKTRNTLRKRVTDHMSDARRGQQNHRCNWIRSLLSQGMLPIIDVVEIVSRDKEDEKEKFWISFYKRENLTNGTDGGEGTIGFIMTDEIREKLSTSHLGQKAWNDGISTDTTHLSEFQYKQGSIPYNKGVSCSDDTKEKISKSKLGKSLGKSSRTKGNCFGVTFEKKSSKWIAQICFENRKFFIGKYATEYQAGIAYDICSIWISKSVRLLNFSEKEKEYLLLLEESNVETLKELRVLIKKLLGGLQWQLENF